MILIGEFQWAQVGVLDMVDWTELGTTCARVNCIWAKSSLRWLVTNLTTKACFIWWLVFFRGEGKYKRWKRHAYCYYEQYHILNSPCSHYTYQCGRNTKWVLWMASKETPSGTRNSSIFLPRIPIIKGSLCMSYAKSRNFVFFFLTNVSRALGIFPRRPQRHFEWKAHGYLQARSNGYLSRSPIGWIILVNLPQPMIWLSALKI